LETVLLQPYDISKEQDSSEGPGLFFSSANFPECDY
jgi:hypothetical protein